MAKLAAALERALAHRHELGTAGHTTPRIIAEADGWTVADVVCTCGPRDRPFEEQHRRYAIAVVVAGTFQYRSSDGGGLMTPGSMMLGNSGQCFECGHEHGEGDRCVAFWYEPDYFAEIAAGAGLRGASLRFEAPRLPPLRSLAPLVGRAAEAAVEWTGVPMEELAVRLAASAVTLAARGSSSSRGAPPNAEARVTRAIRGIERHPDTSLTLTGLARQAGLSPYHFLRTFERLTGVTPHQFVLRTRLREAAIRLRTGRATILDVALESGFGDVSNFNRAFRGEFGVSPRAYRRGDRRSYFA